MGIPNITREELLADLLAVIGIDDTATRTKGGFTAEELRATPELSKISRNRFQALMRKRIADKEVISKRIGKNVYYFMANKEAGE